MSGAAFPYMELSLALTALAMLMCVLLLSLPMEWAIRRGGVPLGILMVLGAFVVCIGGAALLEALT